MDIKTEFTFEQLEKVFKLLMKNMPEREKDISPEEYSFLMLKNMTSAGLIGEVISILSGQDVKKMSIKEVKEVWEQIQTPFGEQFPEYIILNSNVLLFPGSSQEIETPKK